MLTYHQTTEAEKYRITAWEYEGEYAIYNATPYAEQKKKGFGFANPLNHFYSFYAGEELVGFINLYEEETEVFFGIGVAPAHCGKGYGRQMTEIACTLSRTLIFISSGKFLYFKSNFTRSSSEIFNKTSSSLFTLLISAIHIVMQFPPFCFLH